MFATEHEPGTGWVNVPEAATTNDQPDTELSPTRTDPDTCAVQTQMSDCIQGNLYHVVHILTRKKLVFNSFNRLFLLSLKQKC